MLTVKNLSKHYGDTAALGGISFHIAPGETTGVFGMPASGKTTLMDILSGYLLHYSGSVEICGADLRKQPALCRSNVAYIPAGYEMYPDMLAEEYVLFICGINGKSGKAAKTAGQGAMRFSGVEALRRRQIRSLNALERARLAIAAALSTNPKLMLIDQPFDGLRTEEITLQQALLKAVAQRVTLIVAADSISGFSEICKRTIVLNKGRIAPAASENLFAMQDARARVRLRIACAPAQAKAALQFVPGVRDIDFFSASERGIWDVLIHTEGGEDIRKQIWFAAAASKVPVLEMRYIRISPEDVFLQLTGQSQSGGR